MGLVDNLLCSKLTQLQLGGSRRGTARRAAKEALIAASNYSTAIPFNLQLVCRKKIIGSH